MGGRRKGGSWNGNKFRKLGKRKSRNEETDGREEDNNLK